MADRFGIEHEYFDASGDWRTVSPETVEALRDALGGYTDEGDGPLVVPVGQSPHLARGELQLEDGSTRPVDGRLHDLPLGYHTFITADGDVRDLVVHPGRCHLPSDLLAWGWVAQLYATRSSQSWGIGDLEDLCRLADWTARMGGGFLQVNPLGAPVSPAEPSPYSPSTRRYRSPLYLRPEAVPGAHRAGHRLVALAAEARALNDDRVIDRAAVWRLKRLALQEIWASSSPPPAFESWLAEQPLSLGRYAAWSAGREGQEQTDQGQRFHAWLQWALQLQLEAASSRIRLIQDLPVGVDPGGFDALEWEDLFAPGVTIGSPPDTFNRAGQDWGLGAFVPWKLRRSGYRAFIETIRANMSAGGGLRIDHAMGLFRLWMIPEGTGPEGGAYVRYPAADLLGIIALESQRSRAVVVAEDLGTVEDGVREELERHGILSSRLLWFEDDPPERWQVQAMAAVTTHDLPTVAGLWTGADLERQARLGLEGDPDAVESVLSRLAATTGLDPSASSDDAIRAAHRTLARSPSMLIGATLEDATNEEERTNMPGTATGNWSLALRLDLDELERSDLARDVARSMRRAKGAGAGG